jgi:twitching motility protein PilT
MNASAYDLPDGEGELPPPPGPSMFETPSYLNAPPPSVPPGGFASAPPPVAGRDFSQPFDPGAFPPPGSPATARETFRAMESPVAPPPFNPAAYDSSFDPSAYAAPTPAFDTAFDPDAFAPPSSAAPWYDSSFDPPVFDTPVDDSVPVFDASVFDAPAFDTAAFGAVPVEPSTPIAPPAWDAPTPPAAASPAPVAPAFEAPAVVPVVVPAAQSAATAESLSRRAARVRAAAEAEDATDRPQAPIASASASATATVPESAVVPEPAASTLFVGEPAPPPAFVTESFAQVPAPLSFAPSAPHTTTPHVEALQFTMTPSPFGSPGVDESLDDIFDLGQGQLGSDPDLVAALNIVVSLGASDLHVSVGTVPLVRIDGSLQAVPGFDTWDSGKVTSALHSILTAEHRDQFENELELDFAYTLSKASRFRVNIYQQRDSIGAAFRLIPTEIKQLAALGIPERIGNFAQLPRGLVLITGPTGSGKSTTLAALIDLVNSTRSDHIVTVEDPIEFMHTNKKSLVNQREVGHDTHSFNSALKHVLRQDPDVILIGELRDLETISVALTAAETGHLVFATLHTQDAPQTIDRVIDVFPPHQQDQVRAQLAATLQGVVCQTLVKKAHGGRAVATEVLITTPAVANLIREGKTYQIHSAMQAGRELGMHTMDQHLADLVNARQVTHQAAYEKAHDLEDLKQLISRSTTENTSHDFSKQSDIDFDDSFSRKAP